MFVIHSRFVSLGAFARFKQGKKPPFFTVHHAFGQDWLVFVKDDGETLSTPLRCLGQHSPINDEELQPNEVGTEQQDQGGAMVLTLPSDVSVLSLEAGRWYDGYLDGDKNNEVSFRVFSEGMEARGILTTLESELIGNFTGVLVDRTIQLTPDEHYISNRSPAVR